MFNLSEKIASLSPEKLDLLSRRLREQGAADPPEERILPRGAKGEFWPLSFAQQRLWFLDQMEPGRAVYNVHTAVRLKGGIGQLALQQALDEVVRRHEVLRTVFVERDGDPAQLVLPPRPLPWRLVDLGGCGPGEAERQLRRLATRELLRPFDLRRGPLLRVQLLRLSRAEHVLLLTMHHVVSDGWSMRLLVNELAALYASFSAGRESPLAELALQYADFAVWQRGRLARPALQRQLDYWAEHLAGAPPALALPTDRRPSAGPGRRGAHINFRLPGAAVGGLRHVAGVCGATLFMVLVAAFAALLGRYADTDDVVVGVPAAGRVRRELEGLIGFFVNTLALRVRVDEGASFRALVAAAREAYLGGDENQEAPFEAVVARAGARRDGGQQPLFQVMLNWLNVGRTEGAGAEWGRGLRAEPLAVENPTAKFALSLTLCESGDGVGGELEYDADLFERETAERLLGHFQVLLTEVVEDCDRRVADLRLMTGAERARVLTGLNETRQEFPMDVNVCVHELVEAQVGRAPDAVALVCGDEHLSYGELNERANRLARHLRARGVVAESRVGVMLERSPEAVVGMLAAFKAGGAYVPLDPKYPRARLEFMLRDAGVKVLLTKEEMAGRVAAEGRPVVRLDADWPEIARHGAANLAPRASAANLAYLIYTSGSTGVPKGVLGPHGALLNRCTWMWQTYPFAAGEVCCHKTSPNFVDSVWEIFGPLAGGIKSVIIPDSVLLEPDELVRTLARHRVTRIVLVPSLLRALLDSGVVPDEQLPDLKVWATSGELIPDELSRRFFEAGSGGLLLNLYGSTEVAADVTWYAAAGGGGAHAKLPIGRPIANTDIYILDRRMRPQPVGIPGEIYVGGANLARGYHERPEMSAERFVAHPLSASPGARLYKTGDLGRLLADGNIDYRGRLDQQVKVRGQRVEIGEVESALRSLPSVREAAVVADADQSGERRLVAYFVPRQDEPAPAGDLHLALQERLPPHMIPSLFVRLDALPLIPNGKVDRRALPAPGQTRQESARPYCAPRTPLEEVLAGLWAEVLGLARVGTYDNFFEQGGHSLLATRLLNQLRERVQIEVPLRSIFERPTLAGWAESVAEACGGREAAEEIARTVIELSGCADDDLPPEQP
jgi:amino acid adenylation domain-containing protein